MAHNGANSADLPVPVAVSTYLAMHGVVISMTQPEGVLVLVDADAEKMIPASVATF